MNAPLRRIAHLDMDAFYASVELLRYPQLKSLPVVIGGGGAHISQALAQLRAQDLANADPAEPPSPWDATAQRAALRRIPLAAFARLKDYVGRGVITTATYPARQFGVGSAMGLMKAAKLCPDAILLPVDFEEYRSYSARFKSVIAEIAPVIENRGVDEVYIDFTFVPGGQREDGRVLARLIQKSIFDATGLTCSVGVAPNKLLAKMASEFQKPNGIAIVNDADLQTQVWPLACRKINGIGPKADARLRSHGITTIGELAQADALWLIRTFGAKTGAWLHAAAHGRDDRPVETESAPVNISRETTFERDLHAIADKAELSALFTQLCEKVAQDLQRKGYVGRTVGIKLRYDNFQSLTRDTTLENPTADAAAIRQAAGQCLKRAPLHKRLRLLGVRVGGLVATASGDNMASNRPLALVQTAQLAINFEAPDALQPAQNPVP